MTRFTITLFNDTKEFDKKFDPVFKRIREDKMRLVKFDDEIATLPSNKYKSTSFYFKPKIKRGLVTKMVFEKE